MKSYIILSYEDFANCKYQRFKFRSLKSKSPVKLHVLASIYVQKGHGHVVVRGRYQGCYYIDSFKTS